MTKKHGPVKKPSAERSGDDPLKRFLSAMERSSGVKLSVSGKGRAEPFASMNYGDELEAKMRAFSSFLEYYSVGAPVSPLVASPMPRHYRTTTKRRAKFSDGIMALSGDESATSAGASLLEPEAHSRIYAMLQSMLSEQVNRPVARVLNFAIIRGSYTELCLIFNVTALGADIVRGCDRVAVKLREAEPLLASSFIYHDPAGSKYYFESTQPVDGLRMKRLFGPGNLAVRTGGLLYTFHPAGFSQVNLSIADDMLAAARMLLGNSGDRNLVDLYCGFGFFSCFLAESFSGITGIDYDRNSIEHARGNIKRIHPRCRWRFTAARVEPDALVSILPKGVTGEYFLLDPPRRGTQPGVIETVAARRPGKVLHIFCGVEAIPSEMDRWQKCGYRVQRVIPLDMFPGTANLEVMVLLA